MKKVAVVVAGTTAAVVGGYFIYKALTEAESKSLSSRRKTSSPHEGVPHLSKGLLLTDVETQEQMITKLKDLKFLTKEEAVKAMSIIKRHLYAPAGENPYKETGLPLGHGATISAPHMHALGLDLLSDKLRPGARVLEIGSGSGYLTACFSVLVGEKGRVYAIELIPELIEKAKKNISEDNPSLLNNISFFAKDGLEGLQEFGPFDVIYSGGAASDLSQLRPLLSQLAEGGRAVIPVGPKEGFHHLLQFDVGGGAGVGGVGGGEEDRISIKDHGYVRFVPLSGSREEQKESAMYSGPARFMALSGGAEGEGEGEGERKKEKTTHLIKPHIVPAPDCNEEEFLRLKQQILEFQERYATEAQKKREQHTAATTATATTTTAACSSTTVTVVAEAVALPVVSAPQVVATVASTATTTITTPATPSPVESQWKGHQPSPWKGHEPQQWKGNEPQQWKANETN